MPNGACVPGGRPYSLTESAVAAAVTGWAIAVVGISSATIDPTVPAITAPIRTMVVTPKS
jgi:hypothetical protein